jgi:phage major head subunit gpT-like protein
MKRIFSLFLIALAVLAAEPASAGQMAQHGATSIHNMPLWLLGPAVGGLIVTPGSIAGITTAFNTIFNNALRAVEPEYRKLAMIVPSTTEFSTYAWMGQLPAMREWLGDRQLQNIAEFSYTIKNKLYELSVGVPRAKIEDDQYGIFNVQFAMMGRSVTMHPDQLVFPLLEAGFTTKGYDNVYFFATNHPIKGGTVSNKAVTVLSAPNYGAAIAAILAIKDYQGQPFYTEIPELTLVVGPALQETARQILNADFISVSGGSTQSNVWKGSAKLLVTPRIVSTTAWFLIATFPLKPKEAPQPAGAGTGEGSRETTEPDLVGGLMPFIYQPRVPPEFVAKVNPQDSDIVAKTDTFEYFVRQRDNAGYGLYQLAYGSTGAGS